MNLVQLDIKGISYSQTQSGAYALLLMDRQSGKQLPIVIGAFEAQSIAIALEKGIQPPRPLTHDLFKSFSDSFGIYLKRVVIHKLVDGIFYASMICTQNEQEKTIDARTSDAIALALRFNSPIYTYHNILEKAGIFLNNSSLSVPNKSKPLKVSLDQDEKSTLKNLTLNDLNKMLEKAVENENYEEAVKLRDEISKRS